MPVRSLIIPAQEIVVTAYDGIAVVIKYQVQVIYTERFRRAEGEDVDVAKDGPDPGMGPEPGPSALDIVFVLNFYPTS
jgi:hypothetical protein